MNTLGRTLLGIAFLLAIMGCARREDESEGGLPLATATAPQETAPSEAVAPQAAKVVAPIKVEVVLSPAAQADLLAKSEGVVLEAVYGGDPTAEASSQANEFGLIELGKTVHQLSPSGGEANLSDDALDRNRLSLVVGQPQVMINVRSALKASPNNLLSCDLYWDSVQAASERPIRIPCKLLSEN